MLNVHYLIENGHDLGKVIKKIETDNRTGIKGNELISPGKDDLEGEELRNEILCDPSRM